MEKCNNMSGIYQRFENMIGSEAFSHLRNSRVAVFGIGGVGSYVVEALARSGIGELDLIDADEYEASNLNRQLYALRSTIGVKKTHAAMAHIKDIDPDIKVNVYDMFYLPETAEDIDITKCDYVVDAIDTVTAKIELICRCKKAGVPIISSMGTGNKTDPTKLMVSDIYKTSICPLAKVMRRELKKREIKDLKVVYSTETPLPPTMGRTPGSCAFVPATAGLIMAGEVVRYLMD